MKVEDCSAPLTVLFAGGGSGGHIAPGLAIAERLREIDPATKCLFACSQREIDRIMLEEAGEEYYPLAMRPPTKSPWGLWRFIRSYGASRHCVSLLIKKQKISLVVGMGGFVAAPALSAANMTNIPTVLINLDDPPGKANRYAARFCGHIWSAIELPDHPTFAERVVGMPLRTRSFSPGDSQSCKAALGLDPHFPVLFVTGASQGASSINNFMMGLAKTQPRIFEGWQVYHLAGRGAVDEMTAGYAEAGIAAVVESFRHEMGVAWGAADFALSRAGAGSVAEVAANAVPTLFLPYPHHRDNHQRRNANPLVALGGAIVETDRIEPEKNLELVGPILQQMLADAPRRAAMRRAMLENPAPDAARHIAHLLVQVVSSF